MMSVAKAVLLATALAAMTVTMMWLVSDKNITSPDPWPRRSVSPRDRQENGRETAPAKTGKLFDDDLLTLYQREGAAAALAGKLASMPPERHDKMPISLVNSWEGASAPEAMLPWIDLITDSQLRDNARKKLEGYLKWNRSG